MPDRVPPSRSEPPSPFGTATPAPASAPAAPERSSVPSLPWGSPSAAAQPTQIQPGAAPGQPAGRTSASPFDALVTSDQQPVRARADVPLADEDDDDWDEDEPEGSYTWLHYIVLVVVAFVLGLLVWRLLLAGPDESFQTDQEAAAAVTTLQTLPDGGAL